jgi:hypothetical protein
MSKQTDLINIPDAITVSGSSVGIGTSSPNDKLHVDGASAFIRVNRTDGEAGITLMYNGNNSTRSNIATATNGDLIIDTANTERMRIDSSGNVGIGAAPSTHLTAGYNLRLDGGAQTYLAFNNDTHTTQVLGGFVIGNDNSAARITQRENQPIIFATNDTTRMTIDNLGRVTTPSQPAFMARLDTSFTVGPNPTTLPAGTAVYNIGGHYSTGTYRFTAPVAGRYLFALSIQYGNTGGSHVSLYVNNSASFAGQGWIDFGDADGATQTMIHNLAAGDYVEAKIYHTISNTPVSTGRTKWMGYLIG